MTGTEGEADRDPIAVGAALLLADLHEAVAAAAGELAGFSQVLGSAVTGATSPIHEVAQPQAEPKAAAEPWLPSQFVASAPVVSVVRTVEPLERRTEADANADHLPDLPPRAARWPDSVVPPEVVARMEPETGLPPSMASVVEAPEDLPGPPPKVQSAVYTPISEPAVPPSGRPAFAEAPVHAEAPRAAVTFVVPSGSGPVRAVTAPAPAVSENKSSVWVAAARIPEQEPSAASGQPARTVNDERAVSTDVAPAAPSASPLSILASRRGDTDPAAAAAPTAGASAAPPPRSSSGPTQGDVFLDGARVGRWMSDTLARAAGGPAIGSTAFDPRLGPTWPGALQGN